MRSKCLMTGDSTLQNFSSHYSASMQGIFRCRAVDPKKDGGGSGES